MKQFTTAPDALRITLREDPTETGEIAFLTNGCEHLDTACHACYSEWAQDHVIRPLTNA